MNNLRYWMNRASNRNYCGPREGAVLMLNGAVVRVPNFADWSGSHQILSSLKPDEVEATFTKAPTGGWGGQAEVVGLRGRHFIYTGQSGDDLDTCVAEMVTKLLDCATRGYHLGQDPTARLDALLASHDWYSAYSDDAGVSSAGDHDWDNIAGLLKSLPVEVARTLFAKHAPKEMTCPV